MEDLKKYLQELSSKDAAIESEDFSAYDASGGNFDDAYSIGVSDGEISLARELLDKYFPA